MDKNTALKTNIAMTLGTADDKVLKDHTEIEQANFPCSRQETWNLVTNKLMPLARRMQEIDQLSQKTAAIIDILFLFIKEEGLPVVDGRIKFTVEEMVGWATARAQIKAEASAKEAELAAAIKSAAAAIPPAEA